MTPSESIINRVLKTIKEKFLAEDVYIVNQNEGHYIMIKNQYGNSTIYVKRKTIDQLNDFISGYYACWSDMQ